MVGRIDSEDKDNIIFDIRIPNMDEELQDVFNKCLSETVGRVCDIAVSDYFKNVQSAVVNIESFYHLCSRSVEEYSRGMGTYFCITIVLHISMASCTIRMSDKDKALMESYAEFYGVTLSEFIRQSVMERLEDEFDIRCADEAYSDYLKDPETVPFKDVKKKYGL